MSNELTYSYNLIIMKINFFSLLTISFCIVFYSCYIDIGDSISGNGHIVTEERPVENFNSIKVANGLDVFITQGDEEYLKLEIDENLLKYIRTEVENEELKIYSDINIRMAKSKKIFLTYKKLKSIKISSAGDIKGENILHTGNLNISLSSAGNLHLDIIAEKVKINISSSGNAYLSGKTNSLEANLSSAGDLYAFELMAEKGNIDVSSAGDAKVHITSEAYFSASSAGDIVYIGEPEIKEIKTSSAGNVRKR